jgi:segregation and condensation protein A
VLKRADLFSRHAIKREALSVRERMSIVLDRLRDGQFHGFESFFIPEEGRMGVVVTFLAILELAKERLLEIVQEGPLTPIFIRARELTAEEAEATERDNAMQSEFDEPSA